MRLGERDYKVAIYDIETLKPMFDIGVYNPDTKGWVEFEISRRKNDMYKLMKYYTSGEFDFWVSFNGLGFDHQVLQYILDNHQEWFDLKGEEIAILISKFASSIIENQQYEIPLPYKEYQFPVNVIDVFKIHHFDNKSRRTSLKACEFMMNMDVEEMPVHHTVDTLTEDEMQLVKDYRRHDVIATLCLLYLTLGQPDDVVSLLKDVFNLEVNIDELKDYKGKNKIQDRLDLIEGDILPGCLNYSDSKIGDELNKLSYCKLSGKKMADLFTLRKSRGRTKRFTYGDAIPTYVTFKTPEFQKLYDSVKDVKVSLIDKDKQEFPFSYNGTNYLIARGGIHSGEKNRMIKRAPGMRLTDADVGLNCGPSKTL